MTTVDIERWSEQANALQLNQLEKPRTPIGIFILEAETLSDFIDSYWDPAADGTRPGLEVVKEFVAKETGEELMSIARACRSLHAKVIFSEETDDDSRALLDEATSILDSLGAAVEFVLDDDVEEPADKALETLRARMAEDDTRATFIQALADYASIAETVKERLLSLGGFDEKEIARAAELANLLGAKGVPKSGRPASEDIERRNRYLTLLIKRVGEVRRAARYVFRHHPKIATQATSAYERRRRIELKRKKLEEASA